MNTRAFRLGAAIAAAVIWGGSLCAITAWRDARHPLAANRPIRTAASGFVSSETCRACHPGTYESWHTSFHRTMTQVATLATIEPRMDGVTLTGGGWTYRVERQGDTYAVRRRQAGLGSGAVFGPARRIVLLTGSHNMQFFWMETGAGRTLEHFPFGWIVADRRWAPLEDTFLSPPEFHPINGTGDWNRGCIDCHTTQGRSRPQQGGAYDSRVVEFGISCEACHGAAEEHIRANRNPLRRYAAYVRGGGDTTIANPARMNGPASALVCGQCHSVWSFTSDSAYADWVKTGSRYHPGDPALPERFIVQPQTGDHLAQKRALLASNPHYYEDSFWKDGMVRVVGREYNAVAASPCFRGGKFSCLSCHDMHAPATTTAALSQWADTHQLTTSTGDRDCLQCHPALSQNVSAHTHHAAGSEGSSCYNCHMPYSSFGLLRAVRSHQVSSPSAAESGRLGRPNACNLCHLDKTLAWTAEKLETWYRQPQPDLHFDERTHAAGVLWLVKGDAGQRALAAWSMGWKPAQKASGTDWLAPYLIVTQVDPYAAVRFVAAKSLLTLPGFTGAAPDFFRDRAAAKTLSARFYKQWKDAQKSRALAIPPDVGLDADGSLDPDVYRSLLLERDNRFVFLVE